MKEEFVLKKIIVICLLTCLLGAITVHADIDVSGGKDVLIRLNIINENYFLNTDTVTREECIVAIMRVIGVTDEEIDKLNGSDLISFADTDVYSYIGCADLAQIAYGEECIVNYQTPRNSHTLRNTDFFFFPDRLATMKETIAFMIRCLEETSSSDINYTFERAKDYGILDNEDSFINKADFPISQSDFCILLERFLREKRYKYFSRENDIFKMEGNIDEKRSISYFDMLSQRIML